MEDLFLRLVNMSLAASVLGAAVLLLEKDCQGDELYEQAEALLRDRSRRDDMIRALTNMAVPDAGEKIYITLRSLMRG